MSAKQAAALVAGKLRKLVVDIRRCVSTLPTVAERATVRDVAISCVALHTMTRRFEPLVSVASQVMQTSGGEGFILNFIFGQTSRKPSPAAVVRTNADCRKICAVAAMIEYRQAALYTQWALAEGSGFLFPSVLESGAKENLALTPAQMASNLQTHLRPAGMEDKRYTLHSFRVGGGGEPPWTVRPWTFS